MIEKTTPHQMNEREPETWCSQCFAVFLRGVWQWNGRKQQEFQAASIPARICPACFQVQNDVPHGILSLIGVKVKTQLGKILREVTRIAADSYERDPLVRIIRIQEKSDEVVVYTTDAALAKKIGRYINRAQHGSLSVDASDRERVARVVWISK